MIQSTQEWILSSDSRHKLAVYFWHPDIQPIAVVQIVHGMREHMNRYADFAGYLCSHGIAVCGHDQLGHGKTAQVYDDFGYFGKKNGGQHLVRDAQRVTALLRQRMKQTPVFLLGHSMGSFVARLQILYRPDFYSGFVCTGTASEHKAAPFARVLSEFITRLRAENIEAGIADKFTFHSYLKRFKTDNSSAAWLSRDTDTMSAFLSDKFCERKFTNRALCDLFDLQMAACSKQWAGRVNKKLPILLLSGSEDPVGAYGKGARQTYERLKSAGVEDVRYHLYQKARHELLNEINREEVYYDILRWIKEHI